MNAQLIDVVTASFPVGLALHGNDLYYSEGGAMKISKIDITDPDPTSEYVTFVYTPSALALNDNDLYIGCYGSHIEKIDVTDDTPVPEFFAGIHLPFSFLLNGNDLYVTDFSSGKIVKFDITASAPEAVVVVSELESPSGLALSENYLYFSQFGAMKVSKVDITNPNPTPVDVITELEGAPQGLLINGDDLYIGEYLSNKIIKIDITDPDPTPVDFITNIIDPRVMLLNGNDLYIAQPSAFKISKFTSTFVSTESISTDEELILYPNPTIDCIKVSGLKQTMEYRISNLLGIQILKGELSSDEEISLQHLNSGVYFLQLKSGKIMKFIKD